ncbi:MAG TPA: permease-like cell division protein FtsX [Erysipelotrichaceae bacterium]|nr:permease-like cell division protein FtsX [Erysipelotrichaceae bacterium]
MNRIIRPIKEGFIGLVRHLAMSVSSIMAVIVTLLLVSLFLILTVNLQQITDSVQAKVQIHVQIENEVDLTGIADLKREILELPGVVAVDYSDKDEELNHFIESYGEEGKIFEMYRGDKNPLRNAFIIEVSEGNVIDQVSTKIENMSGIESVNYGGLNALKLIEILNSVRDSGLILVLVLGVLAVFLITNTIKMSIHSRMFEIQIMRTIGATNGFIRAPFMVEGVLIGFIGSLIPIGISIFGYKYLYESLNGVLLTNIFELRPVFPFVFQLSYLLIMLGISVGLVGSFISVSRYLRTVR